MGFDLTPLRTAWLVLALLGAIAGREMSPSDHTTMVGLVTLALWCLTETTVRRNWIALLTLPAMMLGIGCALPLYLYFRSRRIV